MEFAHFHGTCVALLLDQLGQLQDPPLPPELVLPHFHLDLCIRHPLQVLVLLILRKQFLVVNSIILAASDRLLGQLSALIRVRINIPQLLLPRRFIHNR